MQKLYIKIAQHTHYLLFCFGFKTYLAVIFRKVLIGEVLQIPKLLRIFGL